MSAFIQKHGPVVIGQLTGLDRFVLRGSLRPISYVEGMMGCLRFERVLLKEFGDFAESKTRALVSATEQFVARRGREIVFLPSPKVVKEEVALGIAQRDGIDTGLICVLKTLEPCVAFDIRRNRAEKRLELVMRERKCSTFYHYAFHPEWGFCYARIQTWLPFRIQVYLNGREWLARRLDQAGIAYERADNTFTWIEDLDRAQAVLDSQFTASWKEWLEPIARLVNPLYPSVFSKFEVPYSWTMHQTEVATDTMFRSSEDLRQVYRGLVLQGISTFGCGDVLRFLGHRRTNQDGSIRANFTGDVSSDLKQRPEGLRLKHGVKGNSVKTYDKAGSVLRVETTINNTYDFKVERPRKESGQVARQILRKDIEDLPRLGVLAKEANERYLAALASLRGTKPLEELTAAIGRPAAIKGRRVRALHPHGPDDSALLRAVSRGDFMLNGFRNRDICRLLHPDPSDSGHHRRQRSNVTRRLRMLVAHGLIQRLAASHSYQLTDHGRVVISAILAALQADTTRLTQAA